MDTVDYDYDDDDNDDGEVRLFTDLPVHALVVVKKNPERLVHASLSHYVRRFDVHPVYHL